MAYFLYYLVFISLVAGITFAVDKSKAKKGKWRVPEATLHWLEAAGGVLAVLLLMYTIRHKNAKFSYYWKTYFILLLWGTGIFLYFKYVK